MLQLRRVHPGGGRAHRVADQPGVHRPQHVEPAVADARQLDRRGAGGAGPGRFVRFHPHDVQRRRTRRFFVRQDRQGAAPQHPRGAADLLFEGYLPPHRGAGPLGTGLHLLVARQHGTDHRHHQADRGQDERRRGHPRRGRAGHPSGRGLDPLLFHLFTGDLQTAAAAKHRIPEGRLQRAAAGAAQTRAPENPAGALLRGGRGTVRALQEKPAGRDLRRGVRTPPQRPARERETRRRHRPLPPHPGG